MSELALPEGWVETTLEKVAKWGAGGTPSRANKEYFEGDIPWIKTGDLGDRIISKTTECITNLAIENSSAKVFKKGSVALAMYGATIGKTSILGMDSATNQACAVGEPNQATSSDFLYYLLKSEKLNFIAKGKGGAQPNISQTIIKSHEIYFPALAEQNEIVRFLDTNLKTVSQIQARLDAIPKLIEKFRQSVLNDAMSGKLTEEWRQKNQYYTEGFNKYIDEYRKQKFLEWTKDSSNRKDKEVPSNEKLLKKFSLPKAIESIDLIPEGWSKQKLDGLIYISARIGWKGLKASEYTDEGPMFLSVHSLNYGKEVKLSEAYHISIERYQESLEIALKIDDILLCKDGAGIGKIGIIKQLDGPATINSSLLLIRAGEMFNPDFLYYLFKGPRMQEIVIERKTGTAVPHLFQRDIKEFVLDVPPKEEQNEIVKQITQLFAHAEQIEKNVATAKARVDHLTQSILHHAFTGNLTAEWREQNPELISGENSAEALLAKIKAEKQVSGKKVKKA